MSQKYNKDQIRRRLKNDLVLFGKVCVPNMFAVPSPPFHYKIAEQLVDDSVRQICIIAPRGHAKSSLVGGIYPLYHLMFEKGPKLIVLVSRTQDHAVKLLGTIKDVLDYSQNFRSIFGYWGMQSARKWSRAEIELKDGSMIICKGTGQQIRGIKVGNQRPTLIIVDDPEDEMNTKTVDAMEGNLRWLLQSAMPSLDPRRGKIVIIGTPQHQRCMVEVLKEMDGWKNMYFAPDIKKKKALWEEWFSIEKLKRIMREMESINRVSVFYREYLCQIIGDEDQLFREEDIQFYDGYVTVSDGYATLHLTELNGKKLDEERPINIFTGVDPASSTRQTADYTVIFNLGVDNAENRFVLPYYRKRAKPMEIARQIIENFKKYRPLKTRIESVGYQEMLRQYVRSLCDDMGLFIPGLEIKENPRTSKSSRLESLQPYFAQKRVYIKKNMRDLVDELLLYPRGKHDDLLDGMYYANKGSYKAYEKNVVKTPQKRFSRLSGWLLA